jgi:hypothetical protein
MQGNCNLPGYDLPRFAKPQTFMHNFVLRKKYPTKSVSGTACGSGGIAQLGERLHGMQEVSGSIPLTSTKRFCS